MYISIFLWNISEEGESFKFKIFRNEKFVWNNSYEQHWIHITSSRLHWCNIFECIECIYRIALVWSSDEVHSVCSKNERTWTVYVDACLYVVTHTCIYRNIHVLLLLLLVPCHSCMFDIFLFIRRFHPFTRAPVRK